MIRQTIKSTITLEIHLKMVLKHINDHKVYLKKMDLIHRDKLRCLQELRKNMCRKLQTISVIFRIKKNTKYTKFKKMNKFQREEEIG